MRLDIDRVRDAECSAKFTQMIAGLLGQIMESTGIELIKSDLVSGVSTRRSVLSDVRTFDFAPKEIAEVGVCAATDLVGLMATLGISRMKVEDVSEDDKKSLSRMWNEYGLRTMSKRDSRLAAPPDMTPDMKPVEVDL